MKLKELCEETGLSRKTVRLYEEKGLIVPRKEERNGREYREYSAEDAQSLKQIATLRRAWFTMDEIKRMQENPEEIQRIFPSYRSWLRNQKVQLEGLLAAAEQIDPEAVGSLAELSEKMAAECGKLPLPKMDVEPHFKYLDELEEGRNMRKENESGQEYLEERPNGKKTFRQTTLIMDQDQNNNLAIPFGQVRDWEKGEWQPDNAPVARVETEPKWMKVLSVIGEVMLVAGFILVCIIEARDLYKRYDDGTPMDVIVSIVILLAGIVLSIGMRGLAAWRERRRWLRVVRQQEEEKKRKP